MICTVVSCSLPLYCKGFCRRHYKRHAKYGDALAGRTSSREARTFIDEVCKMPMTEGCVIWPYSTDKDGYAKLGTKDRVSRVVCEKVHGLPNTPTHHAAHSCGRGMQGCIAWWHLSWKTLAENNADKISHGTSGKRQANPNAKLTENQVNEIKESKIGAVALSKLYGVSRSTIFFIRTNKTWRA